MPAPKVGVPAATLFLRDRYGGDFTLEEGTVTVDTTVTDLVKNDPECVALFLQNMGANNVYVGPTNTVKVGGGVLLLANAGSVSLTVRDDAILPARGWYGIADTAASDVYYVKVRRYITTGLSG